MEVRFVIAVRGDWQLRVRGKGILKECRYETDSRVVGGHGAAKFF